ncbi:MAG: VWA domain-containing protein [Sneathiella sp.]
MVGIASFFEPEEFIGAIWHRLVADVGREQHYPDASVSLNDMRRRLEIFFRGIGGRAGVEIKAISAETVDYRKKFLGQIGHGSSEVTRARFDGDHLYLPETMDLFDQKNMNEVAYKWLTSWAATAEEESPKTATDPLQTDIHFIRFAVKMQAKVVGRLPGMKAAYDTLLPSLMENRPKQKLPPIEATVETAIHALITGRDPSDTDTEIWQAICHTDTDISGLKAPHGYKTFFPFILWGEVIPIKTARPGSRGTQEATDSKPADEQEQDQEATKKAKRKKSDQIEKDNSLLLHRFESILSWSEMMNINRSIDDDEEENAKKAINDQDEIGLTNIAKKAATKLKFDLDLAPEDVVHEQIAAKHVYPEWDYRKNIYHQDHCRVLAAIAPEMEQGSQWQPDEGARQRIRAVKRQFEALRPKRETFLRQSDGNEIDMDALLRSHCDRLADGQGSNRIYSNTREAARDLSVSVLIDISRSSESWIEGRQVLEISREALMALAIGLSACGDDNALYSFSSLKRDRVNVATIKGFDEALGPHIFSRIGALKPGFYTRLGAAIRHVNKELTQTASTKRLLLVLTDGKPNDLDHYEGRYGVEDTAMAVREARRAGTSVFGITIDKKAQSYFPYIFGRNAYSIANKASDLTRALPLMYRHLVT